MDTESEQDAQRLEQYLREIGQIPRIPREEEVQLVQRMERAKAERRQDIPDRGILEEGDQAQRRLTVANLVLVVSVAKKYMNQGMKVMDLIEAGNIGLQRAAEEFDLRKGHHFSTYAAWRIHQAMMRALASPSDQHGTGQEE
jgi:RNA polymerase primary sigma factor